MFLHEQEGRQIFSDLGRVKVYIPPDYIAPCLVSFPCFLKHLLSRVWVVYREDVLRHLCAFQCPKCGKRFGKSYALKRHMMSTKRCIMGPNGLPKNHELNSEELNEAIEKLQNAKKENIYKAVQHCLRFFDGKYSQSPQSPQVRNYRINWQRR